MSIFSMKLSIIFPILFILGGVLSMHCGEKGAGYESPTEAGVVEQTPTDVTPVVEDQTQEEVLPVEDQTPAGGVLPGNGPNHDRKCRYSTFRRGRRDPCGLHTYARECSPKGPCAFNGYNGYLPVIGNPYYFVQCGAGSVSHCQPCAPGTKWSQDLLTCIHANMR